VTRAALAAYKAPVVKTAMVTLALATTAAYVLYTLDPHTVDFFGTRHLVWTAPFCAIGVARFAQLALGRAGDDSPTEAMLRDPPFLVNLAGWVAAILVIIYGMR
jgi:hypothetical protein